MRNDYLDNTNRPKSFFEEFQSKISICPYWVPLVIYIPFISYFLYTGFINLEPKQFLFGILIMFLGLLLWTITEYTIHRFVFHYEPKTNFGKKIIYLVHGAHHHSPNDLYRLVFPPTVSLPLTFIVFHLFNILPWSNAGYHYLFFASFVLGYLSYDTIHYATHALNLKNSWFKKIKRHHMSHHYNKTKTNYGVSLKVWDYFFKTNKN